MGFALRKRAGSLSKRRANSAPHLSRHVSSCADAICASTGSNLLIRLRQAVDGRNESGHDGVL
jgi:hypothetical protein